MNLTRFHILALIAILSSVREIAASPQRFPPPQGTGPYAPPPQGMGSYQYPPPHMGPYPPPSPGFYGNPGPYPPQSPSMPPLQEGRPPFPYPPPPMGLPLSGLMPNRSIQEDNVPGFPQLPYPGLGGMGFNQMFGNFPMPPAPELQSRVEEPKRVESVAVEVAENVTTLENATDLETILKHPDILSTEQEGGPIMENMKEFKSTPYTVSEEEVVKDENGEIRYTKRILKPIVKPLPRYIPIKGQPRPRPFVAPASTIGQYFPELSGSISPSSSGPFPPSRSPSGFRGSSPSVARGPLPSGMGGMPPPPPGYPPMPYPQ